MSEPGQPPLCWPPAPAWHPDRIDYGHNTESGVRARIYSRVIVTSRGCRATITEAHIWDTRAFHRTGPNLSFESDPFDPDDAASIMGQAAEAVLGPGDTFDFGSDRHFDF